MCSCGDGDGPSAFGSTIRKARKAHRCCECRKDIQPGDRYEYAHGVWDGRGDDYKTCRTCVKRRAAHVEADEALQRYHLEKERERLEAARERIVLIGHTAPQNPLPPLWHYGRVESCNPIFGDLHASINECMRVDSQYASFYRKAWKAHGSTGA